MFQIKNMNYTYDEFDIWNLDCFFLDNDNYIIHFASNGSRIPSTISDFNEDNISLFKFIETLNEISPQIDYNPELVEQENLKSKKRFEQYVVSFAEMAHKGILSFNKTNFGNSDENYHLVCKPKCFLKLEDLPEEFQETLQRTRYQLPLVNELNFNLANFVN